MSAAQPSTALRALCEAYQAAWRANDPAAVLRLFADDATLLPHHGGAPIRGKAALRAFWWPPTSAPATVLDFTSTIDEAQGNDTLGYAWGEFTLRFAFEDNGQTITVENHGTYMMIMQRQADGAWLITHRMWDDPLPQVM